MLYQIYNADYFFSTFCIIIIKLKKKNFRMLIDKCRNNNFKGKGNLKIQILM